MPPSTDPFLNRQPEHAHGLRHDLEQLAALERRRRALRVLGGLGGLTAVGPLAMLGCGGGGDNGTAATATSSGVVADSSGSSSSSSSGSCTTIPSETAGPYPGDGTNSNSSGTVNVLTQSGIVRSDIRSSFGSFSGTAAGVPLTVTLTLVNSAASCANLAGYAIYLWHCNRDGNYSLYSSGVTSQNYLRGVQVTDANGQVTFTTIFPGCYSGRWPHIHFEIYSSLSAATVGSNDVKTSQLALPASSCNQVYGVASGYGSSATNFGSITLATDNVFGDDSAAHQIATVSGDATNGFAASLQVGVSI